MTRYGLLVLKVTLSPNQPQSQTLQSIDTVTGYIADATAVMHLFFSFYFHSAILPTRYLHRNIFDDCG